MGRFKDDLGILGSARGIAGAIAMLCPHLSGCRSREYKSCASSALHALSLAHAYEMAMQTKPADLIEAAYRLPRS